MNDPIKVLLIENQPLTRIGINVVLAATDDITLAGETDNAKDGFRLFAELSPDVTILGLHFPDSCSIDDLDNYFIERPRAKIIVLAEHAGDSEISRALKKGALGYICKDVEPDDLLKAIHVVNAGKKYIPVEIAEILSEHVGHEELTATESKCPANDRRRHVEQRDRLCPRRYRKCDKEPRAEYIWKAWYL